MNANKNGLITQEYQTDEIVCLAGSEDYDLYLIHGGKLLIFGNEGSRVTPIAYLGPGEYFGELSFFDHQSRSAHAVAIEPTTLIKIPASELNVHCPHWLKTLAGQLVAQVREATNLLNSKGIRRKNVETIQPLSIDEQRHYYQLLEDYQN